jgi:ketosteroid isomerase-like protein
MSQQNIEVVERVIDAGARGDIDAILDLHHLDWEGFIPDEYPVAGTWHGHDGVRGFMQEWLDSFDEFTIEADEFFDHGDGVVVAVRYLGRGRLSSIETTDRWFYAYRLREGKVFAWRPYRERAEAFAAIGLDA